MPWAGASALACEKNLTALLSSHVYAGHVLPAKPLRLYVPVTLSHLLQLLEMRGLLLDERSCILILVRHLHVPMLLVHSGPFVHAMCVCMLNMLCPSLSHVSIQHLTEQNLMMQCRKVRTQSRRQCRMLSRHHGCPLTFGLTWYSKMVTPGSSTLLTLTCVMGLQELRTSPEATECNRHRMDLSNGLKDSRD